MTAPHLTATLERLAGALAPSDGELRRRVAEHVADAELDRDVPAWLIALLDSVAARRPTAGWVRFTPSLDDSDALQVLRSLPEVLPVTFTDKEEHWRFDFPALSVDATVSFEGHSYAVHPLGEEIA